MSKRTEAKKARREKRQAERDANWLPEGVLDELVDGLELVEELERFDGRITERGWVFDDEQSDEEFAIWFYPPSGADVGGDGLEPVTTIWMHAPENGEALHLILVGTADDHRFTREEFFARVETVEAFRFGDPRPAFG